MTASIKSLGKQTWRVTLGNKSREFYGGIDHVMQVASILPSGSGSLDLLDATASAGTTIVDSGLSGKTVHVIFYGGLAVTTGYALVGTTITFSDGTTFEGGEAVKILIS